MFAPAPLLEVIVEPGDPADVHFHAAGQGFWVARMIRSLGVDVSLCSTFAGETGDLVQALVEKEPLRLRAVARAGVSGCTIQDRRGGERRDVVQMAPSPLGRHELDDLYGMTLVEGLEADVVVLGGPDEFPELVAIDVYRRLAGDFRANDKIIVADLSGEPLEAVLDGGVTVLKVSSDELEQAGLSANDGTEEIASAIKELADRGADHVIVTRAEEGAAALIDGRLLEARAPDVQVVDPKGAGDSLTGGVAAGLAQGLDLEAALRLGMAAGALNVARHGLASGTREEIERMSGHVEIRDLA